MKRLNIEISKWVILILLTISQDTFSQAIDSTLHKAYKMKSQILLDEFFMNWKKSNELTEKQKSEIEDKIQKDDTLREVYNIANTYYKGVTSEANFIIIADTLKYEVSLSDSIELDYLKSFDAQKIPHYRLDVKLVRQKTLYLEYEQNMTLTNFFQPRYENPSGNYDSARLDYINKMNFINKHIYFFDGGRIKSIQFGSDNIVFGLGRIIINKNLDKAIVYYFGGRYFNSSLWVKTDGWEKIKILTEGGE